MLYESWWKRRQGSWQSRQTQGAFDCVRLRLTPLRMTVGKKVTNSQDDRVVVAGLSFDSHTDSYIRRSPRGRRAIEPGVSSVR
jgi:hypothetical protein